MQDMVLSKNGEGTVSVRTSLWNIKLGELILTRHSVPDFYRCTFKVGTHFGESLDHKP